MIATMDQDHGHTTYDKTSVIGNSPGHTYPEVIVRGTSPRMEMEGRSPSSPGGGAPLRSPRSPTDGRLRARLEASSVGLEELNLLRQNQCRAIEMVKAMLMANIPEEGLNQADQPLEQPSVLEEDLEESKTITIAVSAPEPPPVAEQETGGGCEEKCVAAHLVVPEAVSWCRKRASSMDISIARSLALKAKKLRGQTAAPPVSSNSNQQTPSRRTRSSSFSVEPPQCGAKQTKHGLKKGQSMTTLLVNRGSRQYHQHKSESHLEHCSPTRNSLSGSFLSLGTPNSPKYRSLQGATEEPLTEMDFNSHFRSARSLSGSKLAYEFPSPMHAILLHYDKTESPVLKDEGTMTCKSDEDGKIRMRRASFSGPVGRRTSRHEMTCTLRKDSSLGELPISGAFVASVSKAAKKNAKDRSNDEGVSAFIEMLANRGLARKRQDGLQRKQRMLEALESTKQTDDVDSSAENSTSDELSTSLRSTSDESGDSDIISKAENSQTLDGDSGQWEGSNLSSSGKRGSHVSIRSSTSSKASFSSEEGYFSHPGSPQNKHTNRFSTQSASSLTSGGSLSLYQSECSDEDLLDSPLGKLQDWIIPESPGSTDTLTPSNSGSVEILNLQQSPGAKRRQSTPAVCIPKGRGNESCHNDLPRTSTPLKDFAKSLPVSKAELNQTATETVKITITRAKSSSPTNIVSKQKSDRRDSSGSPKTSFSCNFDPQVSISGSPKECADGSSSPNGKKDSLSWGILPDAPRLLSQWRPSNSKSDSPPNASIRSRFECPRTPTIQEEPKMEEESTEKQTQAPKAPALLQLSISPARENVLMLSPPICNAPKVPSWRKHSKNVATADENTPLSTTEQCEDKPEPRVSLESKQATNKTIVNPQEGRQMGSDLKVKDTNVAVSDGSKRTAQINKSEACANSVSQNDKQHRRLSKHNCDISTVVASTAVKGDIGKTARKTVPANLVIKKESIPIQAPTERLAMKDSRQRGSSPAVGHLQPTPGREYISRTPKSDTTNVFQYPSVIGNTLGTTPKATSSRDIHELLRDWVEARTPTLPSGTTQSDRDNVQAPQCSTLPRGFRTLRHQPLTHTPSEAGLKDSSDTLKRSKRMFHSQELCPKAGQAQLTPYIRITGVQSSKRLSATKADAPSRGNSRHSELSEAICVKQQRVDINELKKPEASPPSTSPQPQPRPRSQTWSRGQTQHVTRSSRNAWVKETIVPPSTPTCKVEARIYEKRTLKPKSSQVSEKNNELSQPKLQWHRTCTEIKDTFV